MQDSQGDQPLADETFPVKNENLSIYLSIYLYGKIHVPDVTSHGGNTVLSGIPGMSGN